MPVTESKRNKRTKNKKRRGTGGESSLSWRNIRQVFDCIVFCTPRRPRSAARISLKYTTEGGPLQLHPQSLPRLSSQPWLAKNRINSGGETKREGDDREREWKRAYTKRAGIVRGRSSMRHPSDIPWTKSQTVPSVNYFRHYEKWDGAYFNGRDAPRASASG